MKGFVPAEAVPVHPDAALMPFTQAGDWAIPTQCGARIVDARMAYGWNECRKEMQEAAAPFLLTEAETEALTDADADLKRARKQRGIKFDSDLLFHGNNLTDRKLRLLCAALHRFAAIAKATGASDETH